MEFDDVLNNLDTPKKEAVKFFAERLAIVADEKWTGEIVFRLFVNQGGVSGGLKVERSETMPLSRKRKVRSRLKR